MRYLVCAALCAAAAPAVAQIQQIERTEALMLATGREDPMPVVEERLQVTIDGEYASTTLMQVAQNNTGAQVEGRYRLRPGIGSHVDGFAYWNGEQKIVGEVFEKQLANQVYDAVTSRRRDPGLLQQDGDGAFAFKVFPIAANEKKRVELRWTKWLDRRGKTVHYRAPVTRSDASITIAIAGNVKNVTSSTHRLDVEKVSGGVRIRSEGARSAGEIQLSYTLDEPDWQPAIYVQKGGEHEGWFALALAAPPTPPAATAKDVTIVVDRSGSMTGEPMEHAISAAADMVRMLDARDRVNVIAFSDEVDPLWAAPHDANAETKAQAIKFITGLHPGGGTDIALALRTGIKSQEAKSENPKVIVFMTDGQSEAEQAVQAAKGDTGDVRLFTVGLGKDVNRPLLQRLAAVKRGRFTYIENASSIESEVRRLATSIAKPLLVDISVEVDGAHATRMYPRSLPDLFAEDELLVTGRLRGNGTAKFIIKGKLAGKLVTFERSVDIGKSAARPWVGSLWAQSRVDHLLEEIALGNKDDELQKEVLELALAYNFITPYTAFLAIPESELGNMKQTLDNARADKQDVMDKHLDAQQLQNAPAPSRQYAAVDSRDSDDDGGGDEEESLAGSPINATSEVHRKGCAGCATSGPDGGLVLIAFALLIRTRRRSRANR
jgi:Ca-activated chloride channel homolog